VFVALADLIRAAHLAQQAGQLGYLPADRSHLFQRIGRT
jgi:hypothetical protein